MAIVSKDQSTNQSVERAFTLLEAFTAGRSELRVSDLAGISGLGTSTTSRFLNTLEQLGYVERDPYSGLYRLTPRVLALAGAALNTSAVYREARQAAQDLACNLGLGVNVGIPQETGWTYLTHFEGQLAPRSYTLVGRSAPLHATALGKALIIDWDAQQIHGLIGQEFESFTPHTITDSSGLMAALQQSGVRGYTTEIEELALGRACLAVPIRGSGNQVVAAISVSGPLSAIDIHNRERELAQRLIETADRISISLGYMTAGRHPVAQRGGVTS